MISILNKNPEWYDSDFKAHNSMDDVFINRKLQEYFIWSVLGKTETELRLYYTIYEFDVLFGIAMGISHIQEQKMKGR